MERKKKKTLETRGYVIGSADEFLGLSKEESEFVDMKMALAKELTTVRKRKNMTQVQVAKLIESSQSRVAKMEACDPSVSIDLLIRSLLALGTKRKTLAKKLA